MATVKKKTAASRRLSWTEKLEKEQAPKIVRLTPAQQAKWGGKTMFIATPKMILDLIAKVPKGKLTTVNLLREKLARDIGTDVTCPITTGIFIWIVANAMGEMMDSGKGKPVPYWRVLREGGKLNEKYPGGIAAHTLQLEQEGFLVVPSKNGKSATVAGYENKLYSF